MMATNANMIELRHISKAFDDREVLRDISVDIPVGKISALMGPSGCGKTTLARVIAGLLKPDSGEIKNLPQSISFLF